MVGNVGNAARVGAEGGVLAILHAMDAFPYHRALQGSACWYPQNVPKTYPKTYPQNAKSTPHPAP